MDFGRNVKKYTIIIQEGNGELLKVGEKSGSEKFLSRKMRFQIEEKAPSAPKGYNPTV